MLFYVQIKDRHDSGVNICRKASVGLWGGCSETLSRDFRGQSPLRKLLGSKEHLDWFIIDLNEAKIIETINAHKINAIHIYSSVNVESSR